VCHDNPPRYTSGGAGTPTANGHLQLGDDAFEFGHFGGLPGPWHTSYHGGTTSGAAPITCQTCHFGSVAIDHTGPGGFYYLDTSGDYGLGGSLGFACSTCHTGDVSDPAAQGGRADPLLHANGTRDVVFDPRSELPPEVGGLPPALDRPSLPYWVTAIPPLGERPVDSAVDGGVWSLHLGGASYEPATKTCFNVPCHLKQSFGGTSTADPLVWGLTPVGWASCDNCHQKL